MRFAKRSNHEVLAIERNHIMLTMILQHELSDSEACSANGSKTHRNPEGQAKRSNHEVLATEREPKGQAKRSKTFLTSFPSLAL